MNARTARKEKSHERILAAAASKLRAGGLGGITVDGVMRDAGMTVGGFYAHFSNRETLIAEALRASLDEATERLESFARGKRGSGWLLSVARVYLSPAHRDNPESGCPLPASLGEISRSGKIIRDALAGKIMQLQETISRHLKEAQASESQIESNSEGKVERKSKIKRKGAVDGKSEREALAMLSLMVGGMALARALRGSPLSDAVLDSCREHIEAYLRNRKP